MTLVSTKSPPARSARAIVQRTRGRAQGFATRLMSPSDFGEILKKVNPILPRFHRLIARGLAVVSHGLLRKQQDGPRFESLFSAHQIGRARSG